MSGILCVVLFCVLAAPVQAQFYDNWNGPSSPGYDEPYVPQEGWGYEDPWAEHHRSVEDTLDQFGMGYRDSMEGMADEQNWVNQMRGNRCSGNWGVQTWNDCD